MKYTPTHAFAVRTGLILFGLFLPLAGFATPSFAQRTNGTLLADSRAENTCVDAAEDQGLRVLDVLEQNDYAGGTEVIMRVRGRSGSASYNLGCDYASNSRDVELYRINDREFDRDNSRDFDDDDRRSGREVRDRQEAESIARQAIEDQLGVESNSEVIKIEETRSGDRNWRVRGRVNGAPFEVLIRASNGEVEDFRLN
jgi:hypothetical protein